MFDEIKFQEMIYAAVEKAMTKFLPATSTQPAPEKKYVHTLRDAANELHMSIVTFQKLKNSGRIPYSQDGRKCIFEINEILAAMAVINGKRKGINK